MPTLRRFGGRRVMSTPSIRIAPAVGRLEPGDHPQRRRLPAPARARGTRRTRRARRPARSARPPSTCANFFCRPSISRKPMRVLSAPRRSCRAAAAAQNLDESHARPRDRETDDRQRRRLVGAVRADQLQVRAERRAVQQARHRELADDDGEGQERAAQHRHPHVGQDHAAAGSSPSRARGSAPPPSACGRRWRAARRRPRGTCTAWPA